MKEYVNKVTFRFTFIPKKNHPDDPRGIHLIEE